MDFESKSSAHVRRRLSTTPGEKPVQAFSSLTVSPRLPPDSIILICLSSLCGLVSLVRS